MATDPIEVLKRELADISVVLDRLQEAIKNSNQQEAANKFRDVEDHLKAVKDKLDKEFGWLVPQQDSA
tara:strand:- start:31 stop:234 length:204 start_codon:yes stop_codon:yes gene_type:complete